MGVFGSVQFVYTPNFCSSAQDFVSSLSFSLRKMLFWCPKRPLGLGTTPMVRGTLFYLHKRYVALTELIIYILCFEYGFKFIFIEFQDLFHLIIYLPNQFCFLTAAAMNLADNPVYRRLDWSENLGWSWESKVCERIREPSRNFLRRNEGLHSPLLAWKCHCTT